MPGGTTPILARAGDKGDHRIASGGGIACGLREEAGLAERCREAVTDGKFRILGTQAIPASPTN
ncbi:hypothetical protein MishRS11D_29840 [Methylomagnum ishizawai]|nr:hypothetical protein MishRS11D_29840 [Methylomagnum ishizawai]